MMTQKRPRHTPEASGLAGLPLRGILLSRSVFSRLQGLSYATLSGSRGSVARRTVLSNGFVEPNEAPLARLKDDPRQARAREVELCRRFAVELDAALGNEATPFARRQTERVGEEGWKVDGIAGRKRKVGHVLGRLPFAHDPREVFLGSTRRPLPM